MRGRGRGEEKSGQKEEVVMGGDRTNLPVASHCQPWLTRVQLFPFYDTQPPFPTHALAIWTAHICLTAQLATRTGIGGLVYLVLDLSSPGLRYVLTRLLFRLANSAPPNVSSVYSTGAYASPRRLLN